MSDIEQEERRFVMRALNEWRKIKGNKAYPTLGELYKSNLYQEWQNFFILSLHEDPSEWHFSHVGEALRKEYWQEHYYHAIHQITPKSLIHEAILNIPIVISKQAPYSFSGQKLSKKHTEIYRMILLPITETGEKIEMICGGITASKIDTLTETIHRKYNRPREQALHK